VTGTPVVDPVVDATGPVVAEPLVELAKPVVAAFVVDVEVDVADPVVNPAVVASPVVAGPVVADPVVAAALMQEEGKSPIGANLFSNFQQVIECISYADPVLDVNPANTLLVPITEARSTV